jgi:hypothetical protein
LPADNKWFTRLVVAAEVVEALDSLGLQYPKVTAAALRDLEKARRILRKRALIACTPVLALAHGPTRSWRASGV